MSNSAPTTNNRSGRNTPPWAPDWIRSALCGELVATPVSMSAAMIEALRSISQYVGDPSFIAWQKATLRSRSRLR